MVATTNSISMVPQGAIAAPSPTAMEMAAVKRPSDNRRSNKPIMEKRRRARINNSLNELKTLILDAMKKDPARHSKLEKADILEMTVKHLQNLQRQQAAMSAAADPSVVSKFRAGFSECATEVGRFPGLDPVVKRRLLQHLSNCINQGSKAPQEVSQVQLHIMPNPNTATIDCLSQGSGIILSNGNGGGVQLVPTRLPNGDIALVLPTAPQSIPQPSVSSTVPPVPLMVPVPQRTSSTASASSSSASLYSPAHSPSPANQYDHHQPRPLSLVVRRTAGEPSVERPWRPW